MDYNRKARNHCQDVDNCGDEDHSAEERIRQNTYSAKMVDQNPV